MANKKLIEVALPLEAINAASAREKSIRHGHPSTLHLWWARRPLAAARAVIWASLVDDPSSHPEQFPTEEEQNIERQRLFKILEDLVVWENSNNQKVLEAAKAEIMKSTNNNPPALLDPFAGGGAIPLEAQRLGLEAHAHDLNPVAVMINKAMIEIPPKFAGRAPVNPDAQVSHTHEGWTGAQGLADDVHYYGRWIKQEAYKRIGHLYPQITVPKEQGGGDATVVAWIWARAVKCPNPACGCEMPLTSSFILSKKKGKEVWVEPIFEEGKTIFKVHHNAKCNMEGTVNRKGAICACCKMPVEFSYIREKGRKAEMTSRLMAIIAEGKNGKIYLDPLLDQELCANIDLPDDAPESDLPNQALGFRVQAYGMVKHRNLFTNRQLVLLCTLSKLVNEIQSEIERNAISAGMHNDYITLDAGGTGALAYSQAVAVYLSFVIDKEADIGSSLATWINSIGAIRNTFARQAISMKWDFAETNPFSDSTGCIENMLDWVVKSVTETPLADVEGYAVQVNAQGDCNIRNVMISTDPPYYDNIGYADLSDYFYVWMRKSLKNIYPQLFTTMLVPKTEELIATPFRFSGNMTKARDFFEEGMLHTCERFCDYTTDDIPITIYYAYKQSDSVVGDMGKASTGWETMLSAIIKAGLMITGTWPIRTERDNRPRGIASNALATSIVLVCRKRSEISPVFTRRNFVNELKRELRPALNKLQASNIAPVDLAQSAIGPGMGVFSKYKQVLESDGTPMTVRSALQIINQELDIYFNEQDGELDRESRFCVELYTQYAFNDVKFGETDTLARAKNTSVAALASQGVLYAQKGTVHLYGRDELSDKAFNNDSIIWLLTQQLTKAMETGGIEACARIVAPMLGSNAEYAKSLAYRLYTIAERKGWAQEAYAYNSLVIAWSDIQSRAAQIQAYEPEQLDLFSFINTKEENDG